MLKRSQITWGVFAGGWLLVLAVAAARPVREHWYVAPFAVMTLCLVWRRDFPKRREALLASWIGPLLMALDVIFGEPLTRVLLPEPAPAAPQAMMSGVARGTAYLMLVHGVGLAILTTWLFRYYGILPLFALMATVWPRRFRNVGRLTDEYPWRRWWVAPIFFLGLWGVIAIFTYLWMMSWPT